MHVRAALPPAPAILAVVGGDSSTPAFMPGRSDKYFADNYSQKNLIAFGIRHFQLIVSNCQYYIFLRSQSDFRFFLDFKILNLFPVSPACAE